MSKQKSMMDIMKETEKEAYENFFGTTERKKKFTKGARSSYVKHFRGGDW